MFRHEAAYEWRVKVGVKDGEALIAIKLFIVWDSLIGRSLG